MPSEQRPRMADGFFGKTIGIRRFGDFQVVEKRHDAGETIPEHEHQTPYVTFVLDGEYDETVAGSTAVVKRSAVLLHARGECHANRFVGRTILINVSLPSRFDEGAPVRRIEVSDPLLQIVACRVRQELYHGDDLSPMIVEGLMLELHGMIWRRSLAAALAQSVAGRAERVIAERYAEPLTLRDVAAEIGADPVRLSRSFRHEIGCTVGERIRQRRIESASQLLGHGVSLGEAALLAGFADQSHFTRAFRAATGLTPGAYRRQIL